MYILLSWRYCFDSVQSSLQRALLHITGKKKRQKKYLPFKHMYITMNEPAAEKSLFSFGIITDIQYADIDDRPNYTKTKIRRYRNSLKAAQSAVESWNEYKPNKVSFMLNLGDTIDVANVGCNRSQEALDKVLAEFSQFKGEIHHTWGNHEMYNFLRSDLLHSKLNSSPGHQVAPTKCYYSFSPHEDFCFVLLDTYEIGVLGYEKDHPIYQESTALLHRKNPNQDKTSQKDLQGTERRFVNYNGGVSRAQLEWLDETLAEARKNQQWVIMAGHQPLCAESGDTFCIPWNYDEILQIMAKYNNIVAYFCGHDHNGGYAQDEHGVHHLTFPAALESDIGVSDYGTLDVFKDRVELHGSGHVPNMTFKLKTNFGC